MAPGARNKFGAPMFEPEVLGSKCAVEESTCDIVVTFGASRSDSASGELRPLAPSLRL